MNETVLASTIGRVTVYREGALVERTATLAAPPTDEITHVTIGDLPACLDNGSLRVSLRPKGKTGSALIAQDFKISLVAGERQSRDDTADSIRNEITALNGELGALRLTVEQLDSTIDRLASVTMPERPQPADSADPTPNPTDARLELRVFLADRRVKLTGDRRQLSQKREETEERLVHLQNQLDQMNEEIEVDPGEIKKEVQLRLRTENEQAGGAVELKLVYLVPGAHWYPSYRLNAAEGDDSLAMHAYVAQHTGEDWTGVTLRLSTAEAQQWTELPELHSMRIGKQQPGQQKKGWRAAPAGAEALFADYDKFRNRMQAQVENITSKESVIRADVTEFAGVEDEVFEMAEEEAPPEATLSEAGLAGGPPELQKAESRSLRAPAPVKKLRRAMDSADVLGADEIGIEELLADPRTRRLPGHEPGGAFLDYHGLRMPASDEFGRGKLLALASGAGGVSQHLRSLVSETHVIAVDFTEPSFGGRRPHSYDGFDFAYQCSTPVDVRSQYDFTSIPVLQQGVKLERRYVTVPREGPEVFRMATIVNPLENPLLAGPMDIYLDGEFFVSGFLKVVAPRGKAEIGLGVEQGVKVARNTVFTEAGDGGLLGGNLVLRHELVIELINNLAHEIDIQIRERIPVTAEGEDEIRVEIAHVEPDWSEFVGEIARERGGYSWDLKIPGGKKRKLKAEYRVKISAKNELVGGNRREG